MYKITPELGPKFVVCIKHILSKMFHAMGVMQFMSCPLLVYRSVVSSLLLCFASRSLFDGQYNPVMRGSCGSSP